MESTEITEPFVSCFDEEPFTLTKSKKTFSVASLVKSIRQLNKSVGYFGCFSMLVSSIIGSGVFISPSLVMHEVSSVSIALMLWLFTGLIALMGALCYCELGTTIKSAGGTYAYLLTIYGPIPAFICSWTLVLVVYPTGIATIALTLGNYFMRPFADVFEPHPFYPKAVGAACIITVTVTNCLSIKVATKLQSVFTAFQMMSVFFLIVLGLWQISLGHTTSLNNLFTDVILEWDLFGEMGSAFFACIWAYNGWQLIGNITEEMVNVEKHLLSAVVTAIPFVIVCYLSINVAFLTVLTPAEIGQSDAVAVDFIQALFGNKIAWIVPLLVVVSCYGAANASIFACPRVTLAAGREGHMPAIFGMIHKTRSTPIPAVLIIAFISLLLLIPKSCNLSVLVTFAGLASWIIFLMTITGIIILRMTQPDLKRPFKVWLIAPLLMGFVSLFLIAMTVIKRPLLSSIVIGFMILGLPVYFVSSGTFGKRLSYPKKVYKKLTLSVENRFNLVPCKE